MSAPMHRLEQIPRWTVCALIGLALILAPPPPAASGASPDDPQALRDTHELLRQGVELFRKGDAGPAIQRWRTARERYEDADYLPGQIDALRNMASAYRLTSQFCLAGRQLQEALQLSQRAGDPARLATVHADLAAVETLLEQWPLAKADLDEGLAIAEAAHLERPSAVLLQNLGHLHAAQGDYSNALEAYRRCVALARQSELADLLARNLVNAAMAATRAQQPQNAQNLLAEATPMVTQMPDGVEKAQLLIAIGQQRQSLDEQGVTRTSGSTDENAEDFYYSAMIVAQRIGDPRSQSLALGRLALVQEQQGDRPAALASMRRAAFLAQQAQADDVLYPWQRHVGRLLDLQGQTANAIRAYEQAISTFESVRQGFGSTCAVPIGPSLREEIGPLYFELAQLLLKESATEPDPSTVRQRVSRARLVIERFKTLELVDYFQDDCVRLLRAAESQIEAMSPTAAVLYAIPLPEHTELILSYTDQMKRVSIPVGSQQLARQALRLRTELEDLSTPAHLKPAQQLYDWLVRPVEEELAAASVDTLVFVPDGALRLIPLAALHDGQRYLIEKYATVVTPSLSLVDPNPLGDEASGAVLACGLSSPTIEGFSELPFVPAELNTVVSIMGGKMLLNEQFLADRLAQELQQQRYRVVHIASHGHFGATAQDTYVLAHDRKVTLTDLERLIRPARFRDEPIELMALSACQTAVGDDRSALGLAGIALKAGARSTLATLWSVQDQASATLLEEFYRQIHDNPGITKAKALQQAQLKLLRDWRYDDPFFWSPFVIIGNWL